MKSQILIFEFAFHLCNVLKKQLAEANLWALMISGSNIAAFRPAKNQLETGLPFILDELQKQYFCLPKELYFVLLSFSVTSFVKPWLFM